MAKLLIIDDEPNVLYSLQAGLESEELSVVTARTGKQGLALLKTQSPDVVIVDVQLPDQSGLELLAEIKRHDQKMPVIVVTAFAATETAIEAMKRGAFEYLLKPVDLYQIRDVVDRAAELRRIQSVPAVFEGAAEDTGGDRIVGQCPAMQEVYKAIGRIAPQDVTVLILGESGTGKELIARALYQHSRRADRAFLAINCAAIPEALLESELFGHEKGAFTGADRQRVGKFEQVNGGTLFLDEIGDMTPATQAKVLRLLQEQRFERVGGRETISADVRIIAATNQNLEKMAAEGKFRQDLLYRLNGVTVFLPPLREREADIPMLAEHFVRLTSRKLEKPVRALAPEALRLLRSHPWPGNVRELQNVIRYGVIQAPGEALTAECLPAAFRGDRVPVIHADSATGPDVRTLTRRLLEAGEGDIYRKVLAEVDRAVLEEILRHVGGNQVHASELLGLSRTTLRNKLGRNTG
ncbi:sigma-54-dependent transcriptional regulator [Zavarzinella formosa]|uniref:sigma-54-dependent transcriptional regulator n=1 Tax=Zavarzinella formosa TaxID=360055 RepID=UPI0002FECCCC|nr:sigma-54 dependent transcriptional regulator [Zavarzinella formosa]